MEVFRIIKPAFAASALTGEGARRFGGRWNPPGVPCVYAAGTRALAALELLVHASPELLRVEFQLIAIEVPDELIEPCQPPPPNWDKLPAGAASQDFGARWLRRSVAAAKAVLALPSVLMPEEPIYLLNPLHPGFPAIRILQRRRLQFDARLGWDRAAL
ncbi:MAG: RES family NAD+ phosphorylase [Verrucomicrobiota bacterium]